MFNKVNLISMLILRFYPENKNKQRVNIMTRKILRFMNVNKDNLLSRDEMKGILAGSGSGECNNDGNSGNECTNCVICYGSSTEDPEPVYIGFNGEDPSQVCRRNGPYASGTWGQCY